MNYLVTKVARHQLVRKTAWPNPPFGTNSNHVFLVLSTHFSIGLWEAGWLYKRRGSSRDFLGLPDEPGAPSERGARDTEGSRARKAERNEERCNARAT